jgi:hypothetical protein
VVEGAPTEEPRPDANNAAEETATRHKSASTSNSCEAASSGRAACVCVRRARRAGERPSGEAATGMSLSKLLVKAKAKVKGKGKGNLTQRGICQHQQLAKAASLWAGLGIAPSPPGAAWGQMGRGAASTLSRSGFPGGGGGSGLCGWCSGGDTQPTRHSAPSGGARLLRLLNDDDGASPKLQAVWS